MSFANLLIVVFMVVFRSFFFHSFLYMHMPVYVKMCFSPLNVVTFVRFHCPHVLQSNAPSAIHNVFLLRFFPSTFLPLSRAMPCSFVSSIPRAFSPIIVQCLGKCVVVFVFNFSKLNYGQPLPSFFALFRIMIRP